MKWSIYQAILYQLIQLKLNEIINVWKRLSHFKNTPIIVVSLPVIIVDQHFLFITLVFFIYILVLN